MHSRLPISIILLLSVFGSCKDITSKNRRVVVDVDEKTGSFDLRIDLKTWLSSQYITIHHSGQVFTTADGSLDFIGSEESHGTDLYGEYLSLTLTMAFNLSLTGNPYNAKYSINVYDDIIITEQYYPDLLSETSTGDADNIVSGFPNFVIADEHAADGYAHWISWFYEESNNNRRNALVAPGFNSPDLGKWSSSTTMFGGIGGTGVTCLFDDEVSAAIAISPLTGLMVVSHKSPTPGTMNFGIMGNVSAIPEGFSVKVIIQVGNGINDAISKLGTNMRTYYGKSSASVSRKDDITLQYLGYTTDNGMYYYYNTEVNKTYEDTLLDVKLYADSVGIPYKYVLLDSWWYFKGENGLLNYRNVSKGTMFTSDCYVGGVSNWSAMPDVFPSGLKSFHDKSGWDIQAHNRYWSQDPDYIDQFEFVVDHVKHGSVPAEQRFWDTLFEESKNWGLVVYEQDWLFNEFYEYVGEMLRSTDLGRQWLLQMGSGANANNLKIQYCMPYVRQLLQSLEVGDVVTQARASDDYVVSPYEGKDNWRIGGQSILFNALGLAPSKDGFWSTKYQPGNPYGEEKYEPYSSLHAVVATLSTGPVAIGDGIGYSDVNLIMKSCMKDGKLLQPSTPALRIDSSIRQAVFGGNIGPEGEVWFASTTLERNKFGFIFVADLFTDYDLSLGELSENIIDSNSVYWAREVNSGRIVEFSTDLNLSLESCGLNDFQLWTIAPKLNGWGLVGEVSKWVGISEARIVFYAATDSVAWVTVRGVAGERVTIGFINPSGALMESTCFIGEGLITIQSNGVCDNMKS